MIVDILEDLPVPMVSSLLTSIIGWNSTDKNFLPLVLDFGSSLVHNNRAFLLFHKDDLKLRVNMRGYAKAYHFSILKEWMGINRLPIISSKDASKYSEWFQPCHMLHYYKHKHLRFSCYSSLIILHSSANVGILYSTSSEELSGGAFFHLLY